MSDPVPPNPNRPDPDLESVAVTAPSEAMGRTVGGGMSWMVVSTVLTRLATFLAQILLGLWLLPGDFALYATATTIAGFLMVCRDMATGHILVQQGAAAYERTRGAAFWLAVAYNVAVAGLTSVVAYPLAVGVYHNEALAPMLIVMAWALPLGAVGNVLYAKLRLYMRFKAFGVQMALSGFLRQVSMVVLAKLGFGPMSFAWPILVCTLFDLVSLVIMSREAPWMYPPQLDQWKGLARRALWLMVNSLANFAMDFGPFLVLPPILIATLRAADPDSDFNKAAYDITGWYFFAYQITAQIGVMIAFNAAIVLVPALQRLHGEPDRQRDAALRSLRTLMLAGSIASLGLACVMEPLEHLLWNGKFAPSVAAVLVFGMFYPWRITFGLCTSILMAQGAFRRLAILSAFECLGLMAAAAAAGVWSPTTTGIAWWTGGWVLFSRLVATWYVFHKMGGGWARTLGAVFPAWGVALAAFAVALLADARLGVRTHLLGSEWLGRLVAAQAGEPHRDLWVSRIADLARILITGSVCVATFGVLARVLLADDLRDMLRVAPHRLRGPLVKLLRLPHD